MKKRKGFVSNSSSSSFIISKEHISSEQRHLIYAHDQSEEFKKYCTIEDCWLITEGKIWMVLSTTMDNFDMFNYLVDVVGIDSEQIQEEI